jgi:hypothetical protein
MVGSITTSMGIGGAIYRMHKGWAVLSITTSGAYYRGIWSREIAQFSCFSYFGLVSIRTDFMQILSI